MTVIRRHHVLTSYYGGRFITEAQAQAYSESALQHPFGQPGVAAWLEATLPGAYRVEAWAIRRLKNGTEVSFALVFSSDAAAALYCLRWRDLAKAVSA